MSMPFFIGARRRVESTARRNRRVMNWKPSLELGDCINLGYLIDGIADSPSPTGLIWVIRFWLAEHAVFHWRLTTWQASFYCPVFQYGHNHFFLFLQYPKFPILFCPRLLSRGFWAAAQKKREWWMWLVALDLNRNWKIRILKKFTTARE